MRRVCLPHCCLKEHRAREREDLTLHHLDRFGNDITSGISHITKPGVLLLKLKRDFTSGNFEFLRRLSYRVACLAVLLNVPCWECRLVTLKLLVFQLWLLACQHFASSWTNVSERICHSGQVVVQAECDSASVSRSLCNL